jgi:AraC family transcriptional regulator, ethanolamine operon transcriptional activator
MLPATSFSTVRSMPAVPTRREHRSFADFESMQTIPGWNVRCLQTTAGTLDGGSRDLYLDGIQVLCEDFRNVTTNYFGCAPADSFTIGVARSMKGYGRLDGAPWCEGVCAFDSRRELNSIVPPMQLLSVVVSRRLLCDYIEQTEQVDLEHWLSHGAAIVNSAPLAARAAHLLLDLLDTCFHPSVDLDAPAPRRAVRHGVLEMLGPLLVEHLRVHHAPRRETGHLWIVSRARDYARQRIADPLQVIDLCRAVGVSRRTLQTSFQQVLGVSPLAYLRAMRLNGARRMLLQGDPAMKVKDAIETWGFWHLSRFSQEYRRLFGELPSLSLRRAQATSGKPCGNRWAPARAPSLDTAPD